MNLLIIDPQNDFMDQPGSALPVQGATDQMIRLGNMIAKHGRQIRNITVTLDWHHPIGIERTTFWRDRTGRLVEPFTQITAAEVRAGLYEPLANRETALAYLVALEAKGLYKLRAWPVHCCQGSWGASIFTPLAHQIQAWAINTQRNPFVHCKGMNPWTEQYGAFEAEVPTNEDPTTQRQDWLAAMVMGDDNQRLLIAGEASSHCVKRSVEQLLHMGVAADQLTLLRDCMGPVTGSERDAEDFLKDMRVLGATVCDSTDENK